MKSIKIDNLDCLCSSVASNTNITYILYPKAGLLDSQVEDFASKFGTTIVVVTGMDWDNDFSPWPSVGVPDGSPDFEGKSPLFLNFLQTGLLPTVEKTLNLEAHIVRNLVGVSMSGLFALWQWMMCDTFTNIASLSGSFWYSGFVDWMKSIEIPHKVGHGYFLLGDKESKTSIKQFKSIADNTLEIIDLLKHSDINVTFDSVLGTHFSNPTQRLIQTLGRLAKK